MDPLWLTLAFLLGLGARFINLPPLVGFLAAGFVLQAMGVEGGPTLERLADIGVQLMLFGIGLKLKVRSLLRPEVWATTVIHMAASIAFFAALFLWLSRAGGGPFAGLGVGQSLLLGFALSFSSTVFVVKILEEQGASAALYGRIAVGILIVQDIAAVVFLTFASGKVPSWWALALIAGLPLIRWACMRIMDRTGHGELVVLLGITLALVVGAGLFELVGLKPDLGALVIGLLVANHPKAGEVSKSLLSFKDVFLVGFFLSIGLSGEPTRQALVVGLCLLPVILLKGPLYHVLLTRFSLRARTSFLSSMALTNYSEFGLIVGALAVRNGWLDPMWLTAMAIAVALSFVVAAPLNGAALRIFGALRQTLVRFESRRVHPEERPVDIGAPTVIVVGMGRVGQGAYDWLRERYGDVLIGTDIKTSAVEANRKAGRNVFLGDATDRELLERLRRSDGGKTRLILLTLGHQANLRVLRMARDMGYAGRLVAVARYEDEVTELLGAGADAAFNLFLDAGAGFAEHAEKELRKGGDCRWIDELCERAGN
ncbi:cation:proton antiporter family protein [Salidesulfovibrio onnuriiensis]|uniref:cation:proton antiporter family protein n=1 Tax=Salidesulfovibrio onnuriiensis TaxID=2583823 RepID=UPI0011CA7372|nr:cation:proton antiporter family protein [Salidesulfovibrio onnuriiensis]